MVYSTHLFLSGEVAIRLDVNDNQELNEFAGMCEEFGVIWASGRPVRRENIGSPFFFEEDENCFCISPVAGGMQVAPSDYWETQCIPVIDFREIGSDSVVIESSARHSDQAILAILEL